jgi:formylglycine-generating enzyme required for sulfatase activity
MSNTHAPDWHWPVFPETLCGTMTDRERLGLPDHYVKGRLDAQITSAFQVLYGLSKTSLLEKISAPEFTLAERIACGNLLALLGDSRIDTNNPTMIHIKGGDVPIGLPHDQVDDVMQRFEGLGLNRIWIDKECPQHTVHLAPYKLAMYPVTNAEYQDFLLDAGYSEIPTSWDFRRYPHERANHPVYTVTPQAADAYVAWLAQRTGRAFRLPTEAEWEWAATGSTTHEFPWGSDFDADLCNTAESGIFNSTPVGIFVGGESPFGIADMAGNVEEYVSDPYQAYPEGAFVKDHLVDIHGEYRVARGGSFARFRDLARNKRRHGHNPKSPTYAMGFRLAESI